MKKMQFLGCSLLLMSLRCSAQWPADTAFNHDLLVLRDSHSNADRANACLRLGYHYLYKPGEDKSDLDSAILMTGEARDLFWRLKDTADAHTSIVLCGSIYAAQKEFSKAWRLLKSLEDTNKLNLLRSMIDCKLTLGGSTQQDFDTATSFARQALVINSTSPSPWLKDAYRAQLIDMFVSGGAFNYKRGEKDLREKEFRFAIWLDGQGPSVSIVPQWEMALIYVFDGRYEQALSFALEAKKLVEAKGNPDHDERPYTALARIYLDIGRPADALENSRKAIDLRIKIGTTSYFNVPGIIFRYLAKALITLNRPREALSVIQSDAPHFLLDDYSKTMIAEGEGDCYAAMGEDQKAEREYLRAITFALSIRPSLYRLKIYLPLGALYVKMGQYSKALRYLGELVADSNKADFTLKDKRDVQLLLFRADSARGDFVSAIRHYQLHKLLNDSIINDKRDRQEEQLKSRYEAEKKDNAINLLRENEKLAAVRLHQTRFVKDIFIVGAIILLVLLGLLYNRYLLKLRSNRLLQDQRDEINQAYARLEQLLNEKEWLVKEIHHRTKNNLQMIMSLIDVQSFHLEDKHAIIAFHNLSHRMRAIALIHQRLYQAEGVTLVNMKSYIPELVSYFNEEMQEEHGSNGNSSIRFELFIDDIQLDVSQSVPIGLILNEAVTNSMKHAFGGRKMGLITIRMKEEDDFIHLSIADNGRGLTNAPAIDQSKSMGFQLISRLSGQLKAVLTVETMDGLIIKIKFAKDMSPDQAKKQSSQTAFSLRTGMAASNIT
jgi:two-component system, sensor histidine kinase PdtaS